MQKLAAAAARPVQRWLWIGAMKHQGDEQSQGVGLAPVGTTVVWIGCLTVGLTGILLPFKPRGESVKRQQPPVQAVLMHVDLTQNSQPLQSAPPAEPAPPAPPAAASPPPAPPIAAVAAPSAALAFALPTTGPTRIVSAAEAVPSGSAWGVERITLGVGEGQQPKPEYPPEAALAREGGTVRVRYTIGEDGSVIAAAAINACPYPLINQSAVRTVRDEWRFPPGPVRVAETDFEFNPK
jgi:protein TonB